MEEARGSIPLSSTINSAELLARRTRD